MKLLKVIFIFLILVTIGEVSFYIYYYFHNQNNNKNAADTSTDLTAKQIVLSLSPKPTLSDDFKAAIHPDQIKDLTLFVNNTKTNEKYYLTIESEGIVTDIDLKGKQVGTKLFPFGLKFKSAEIDDWLWVSPQMYDMLEVYFVESDGLRKTKIDNLKVGDHILIQQMTNLAYKPFDPRSPKGFIIKILK